MDGKLYTILEKTDRKIPVYLTYKSIKNVYARFYNGAIYISANRMVSETTIKELADKLFQRIMRKKVLEQEAAIGPDYYYLLGQKKARDPHMSPVAITNIQRRALLDYLEIHVRSYEHIMSITRPYAIKVRKMRTRYGSNQKRHHTLTFSLSLASFAPAVIDSVIVHELAHYFYFDHSKAFYQTLYNYYPAYKKYQSDLKKGVFRPAGSE